MFEPSNRYLGRLASRRQTMLDQSVQGLLLGRVTLYWLGIVLSSSLSVWCWQSWFAGAPVSLLDFALSFGPSWIGALIVLPWIWSDMLRASSRFVGPIRSLTNALKRLEMGDRVPPLQIRRSDYWPDLIWLFNRSRLRGIDRQQGRS